ncbi:MAG: sulfotransferase domain-containing protein [Actinomycetota bacterium]
MEKVRVVYFAGTGRSGSSIIGNILGQVEGFFSAGELQEIWQRGLVENWLCGCGAPFEDCPIWRGVLEDAFRGAGNLDVEEILGALRRVARIRHVPLVLAARCFPGLLRRRLGETVELLEALYVALARAAGGAVIVDSSKRPSYGYLLGLLPSVDLHVVHLVRDPRGAAYSWGRRKAQADAGSGRYMDEMRPAKSALLWSIWNTTAELLWAGSGRYLRLRYEDVIRRPREALVEILAMLGRQGADLSFVNENTVELDVNHTVSGNPSRLKRGTVELRPDLEWMDRMRLMPRAAVTVLTAPRLRRYGYPFRPRRHSPAAREGRPSLAKARKLRGRRGSSRSSPGPVGPRKRLH